MSDIYIVLRRRLDEVMEWVTIGEKVLRDARKAKGLSMESVSRLIHVSSKTYERWEKRGQVPRHALNAVARALDLEIEQPERRRVSVSRAEDADQVTLREIADGIVELQERVAGLEAAVSVRVPQRDATNTK